MSKYTFVVEFEEGKDPEVGFNTDILGGKILFVSFSDIREEQLTPEEARATLLVVDEDSAALNDFSEEMGADPHAIIEKLQQQSA